MTTQTQTPVSFKHIEGTVQRIDRHSRTLRLATAACPMQIVVSPSCEVRLRGEPVTLHLLQPHDRIAVTYIETSHGATAQVIDIDLIGVPKRIPAARVVSFVAESSPRRP
jgi:hypothetical protein